MHADQRSQLDALTGLRFFAAMHVVFYHHVVFVPGFRSGAPEWLLRLLASAPGEVGLFFVLSGFILTYNYLSCDARLSTTKGSFWVARFARLYPVYILGLFFYLPVATARFMSGTGLSVVDVGPAPAFAISGILTLLLVQAWSVVFTAWNGPSWSVSAEAFFYAGFPLFGERMMRLKTATLLKVSAAIWICSLIAPAYFVFAILGKSPTQVKQLWEVGLEMFPLLRIGSFFIGIAAGVLFLRRRNAGEPLSARVLHATVLVILLLCVMVPTGAGRLLENILTPLFAVLIYTIASQRGILCSILKLPFFVFLGEASFAMYIIHSPLWNYLARLQNISSILLRGQFPRGLARPGIVTEWNYNMSGWMFCLYVVLLVALSLLTRKYIEEPARKCILQYARERRLKAAVFESVHVIQIQAQI